jgi:hypothetical protein
MKDQAVYETLVAVDDYILRLTRGIESTVQLFRQQKEDEGLGLLIQIIDGLSWTIEAVFSLRITLLEQGFNANVEQLNDLLNELLKAMENEDYVLISDILQYEIQETLHSWKNITEKTLVKNI